MSRRPRDIGTSAETATVRYLVPNGFPHAERRSLKGSLDQGDITGTPGVCWEVKGGEVAKKASDGQVALWLAETERERVNARAEVGVLVVQRAGIGPANAGRWWAVIDSWTMARLVDYGATIYHDAATDRWTPKVPVRLHLGDAVRLLRWAGYGLELSEGGAA